MLRVRIGWAALLSWVVACGGAPDGPGTTTPPPTEPAILHEPFASYGFAPGDDLLRRLVEAPYGYFRFTNRRFAEQVCARFEDALGSMPMVNLHGDAHLEQYAVTASGRGLADYDDASQGPAVIDLVRFGVSVRLAARVHGWDPAPTLDAFLEGYREGLRDPEATAPAPACVARMTATFRDDRTEFLAWVDGLMEPLSEAEAAWLRDAYGRYAALMRRTHPELPEGFFAMKGSGRLTMGYGSALDDKFLVRAEGPTDAATDDVVLEAKEVRDLSDIGCITAGSGGGAFRILLSQTRIGRQPIRFLAQVPRGPDEPLDRRPFWIREWLPNYRELDVASDLASEVEMREVARDVGLQLGHGHVQQIAAPFDEQLRAEQLSVLDRLEPRVRAAADELTTITLESWEAFRREARAAGAAP